MLTERFDRALQYARSVHARQKRKGTDVPYFSHLLAVASIVLENGGTEDEAIAALLHDAPEDQGGKPRLADIRARFGARVAEIVEACSDSLEEDPSKKEAVSARKARYQRELRAHPNASVYLVSAADKLHNTRAMAQDERQVGSKLWERFETGKSEQLQNLRALLNIYESMDDDRVERVARELRKTVGELETVDERGVAGNERGRAKPKAADPIDNDSTCEGMVPKLPRKTQRLETAKETITPVESKED